MSLRHRLLFHLALCLPLGLTGTAATAAWPPIPSAPSRPFMPSVSHRPLPDSSDDRGELEKRLSARLGHAQDLSKFDSILDKLLKDKNFDPEELTKEELANLRQIAEKRQAGKPLDFTDPQVQRVMEKMHGLKKGDLGPDDFKALEKIGKQQQDGDPINLNDPTVAKVIQKLFDRHKTDLANQKDLALGDKKLEELWQKLGPQLGSSGKPIAPPVGGHSGAGGGVSPDAGQPNATNPTGGPAGPKPPPSMSDHAATGPQTPNPPPWLSRQLLKIAENIDLDDSDKASLTKLLKDVAKSGPDASKTPNLGNLPDVGGYIPSDKINNAGSFFGKMKMPSLPHIGSIHPPVPHVSAGGSGGGGGVDGLFQVLVGALAVVLVGLVVWKLLSVYKDALAAKGDDPWRLGAWPVHPTAVRTRADLVKAFEHLAVLCLGSSARTQNHLELADELGRQAPEAGGRRPEAARTLAYLYEIARYTPADEPLPPDELATARRELSFLAGAASA